MKRVDERGIGYLIEDFSPSTERAMDAGINNLVMGRVGDAEV